MLRSGRRRKFNPKTQKQIATPITTVTTKALTDELGLKNIPLMHLGIVAAVIVHPSLKLRWEGGFVLPGTTTFRVMATYLFGAH